MANTFPLYPSLWSVPTIPTEILWVLAMVFALIGLLFFAFIFYTRNKQKAFSQKVAARRATLAPMISSFLFHDEQQGKEELSEYIAMKLKVRDMLKDPINRKVFAEILLDLEKDLSGDIHERLIHLYQDFELHKDAIHRLKSKRWDVISRAILELTEMQVRSAYTTIRPFVNHRRSVVRRQAQIATVSLDKEGITYFLDSSRYDIAEWQQIVLLDLLRQFENYTPPRFRLWLTSNNRDVVLFSLRLIRYYKQADAARAICQLLRHKNKQIKLEALGCIKEFGIRDALPILQEVFWKNHPELKIAILDTINFLADESQLAFLREVLRREKDFLVRNKAISGINTIKPDSILPTKDINPSEVDKAATAHEIPTVTEEEEVVIPVEENPESSPEPAPEVSEAEEEVPEKPIEMLDNPQEANIEMSHTAPDQPLTDEEMQAIHHMEIEQELLSKMAFSKADLLEEDLNEAQLDALMYMQGIYELLGEDVIPSETTPEVLHTWSPEEMELLKRISFQEFEEVEAESQAEPSQQAPAEASESQGENQKQEAPETEQTETVANEQETSVAPAWEVEFSQVEYGIFQELFEKADPDSQHILLQQLPEVGEERDLLYLKTLELSDKKLAKRVAETIQVLESRLETAAPMASEKKEEAETEKEMASADLIFVPEFPEAILTKSEEPANEQEVDKFRSWVQEMVGKWYG